MTELEGKDLLHGQGDKFVCGHRLSANGGENGLVTDCYSNPSKSTTLMQKILHHLGLRMPMDAPNVGFASLSKSFGASQVVQDLFIQPYQP